MSEFSFDREKQAVVPTLDFTHGNIEGVAGVPLSDEVVATISDQTVEQLVAIANVAELVAKTKAAASSKAGKSETSDAA